MNSSSIRKYRSRSPQRGVTLVEILVTLIIISVGLLGVAALHLTSLRNSQDSNTRTKAVWLATNIVERMRANREVARTKAYDVAMGATLSGGTVAGDDVSAWKLALADTTIGLPSGDGSIVSTPVGTSIIFTITVQWTERVDLRSSAGQTHTFITQTEI